MWLGRPSDPGGGRGFGFTGGHNHWNWGDDNLRKVVLNAIVWIAHGEVPTMGVGEDTDAHAGGIGGQSGRNPKKLLGRMTRTAARE